MNGRPRRPAALPNGQHGVERQIRTRADCGGRRALVLHIIQPGLAGLIGGSVTSPTPLSAAALATRDSRTAFVVGMATSSGAPSGFAPKDTHHSGATSTASCTSTLSFAACKAGAYSLRFSVSCRKLLLPGLLPSDCLFLSWH